MSFVRSEAYCRSAHRGISIKRHPTVTFGQHMKIYMCPLKITSSHLNPFLRDAWSLKSPMTNDFSTTLFQDEAPMTSSSSFAGHNTNEKAKEKPNPFMPSPFLIRFFSSRICTFLMTSNPQVHWRVWMKSIIRKTLNLEGTA